MSAIGIRRGEQLSWRSALLCNHGLRGRPQLFSNAAYVNQKFILIKFPDRRQYLLNASLLAASWAAAQAVDVIPSMRQEIFWYSYNHCYCDNLSLRKLFSTIEGNFLLTHARMLNTSDPLNTEDLQLLPQCKIALIVHRIYPHQEHITHHRELSSAEEINPEDDSSICPEYLAAEYITDLPAEVPA